MAKTLCDWSKKDILAKPDRLAEIVSEPRYFCSKCARVANEARRLCKPQKLPLLAASSLLSFTP
jgi:hypothetical protein